MSHEENNYLLDPMKMVTEMLNDYSIVRDQFKELPSGKRTIYHDTLDDICERLKALKDLIEMNQKFPSISAIDFSKSPSEILMDMSIPIAIGMLKGGHIKIPGQVQHNGMNMKIGKKCLCIKNLKKCDGVCQF